MRLTQKNAKVFKITLETGEVIQATENHPVYTQDGWKPVNLLTPEDKILHIKCQ